MKVKELVCKLVPNSSALIEPDGKRTDDYVYEFYFDGELIENIQGIKFNEDIAASKPATVHLVFEVDKVTMWRSDN